MKKKKSSKSNMPSTKIMHMAEDKSTAFEIRREIFHVCLGLALLILLYFDIIDAWLIFLAIIVGGLLSIISRAVKIPVLCWFLKTFERKEQLKKFPGRGAIAFLIGVLLAIKLFEPNIAFAAIIILTIGDPISHFVGKNFGRIKNPFNGVRRVEGNIAGALLGGLAASFFVPFFYALAAALAALFFESIEIRMNERLIDDNIIIPLIAGTVLLLLYAYLPYAAAFA